MNTKTEYYPVRHHAPRFTSLILLLFLCMPFANAQRNASVLVADTIDVYPIITDTVNLLANDTIAPGDSIKHIYLNIPHYIYYMYHNYTTGFYSFYENFWGFGGTDTGSYRILFKDKTWLQGKLFFRIHDKSAAWLDTNNVKAMFLANGIHFNRGESDLFQSNCEFYVPKESANTTLYTSSLWIGGKDEQHQLHLAAQRYGQGPNVGQAQTHFDFWAGPIMDTIYYSPAQDTVWNRIWIIRKNEIEEYKANWWSPYYTIPYDILTWPGNGDTTLGQAWHLAPFYDMNGDGIYDPLHGDCPEVRGDECLWFVFNDDRPHTESTGAKMRIEIHGMAYAFDLPDDTAMKNTIFVNYKIYNRSDHTYDSTYLSFFNDVDLGYAMDDYTGCDVERNMSFVYNGKAIDGHGESYAYGANPPAQGFILLSGPLMDPDGLDNPRFDTSGNQLCDFSVNGKKFADGTTDNERLGMTTFTVTHNSGVPTYMLDPRYPEEYYNLMIHQLGGTPINPVYIRFMYPGLSDTTGWGFDCTPIQDWTEFTAGNAPGDRRNETSAGPFTFGPGDVQEIDFAYVWARDYVNPNPASVDKLRWCTDQIIRAFETNQLPGGGQIYGTEEITKAKASMKIYPNPASDEITLELPAGSHALSVQMINSTGNIVKTFSSSGNKQTLDLSGISSGIYLLRVSTTNGVLTRKLVVK